ncbi:MAG: GFA family protein [Bdellovibrionales bacterium]|nr:GFA family protein [Bdellovibrionales bacterium]
MTEYTGGCLCGRVRYKVRGPIKFVAHDHCSICRRAHGAAFVTWCGVKSEVEQFEMVSGLDNLTAYKSSKEAERQFCGVCGSQLFFRSENWPGEVHFTRVSVDQEMAEQPKAHVYFSDRVSWLDCKDGLPKFGGPTGMEPLG